MYAVPDIMLSVPCHGRCARVITFFAGFPMGGHIMFYVSAGHHDHGSSIKQNFTGLSLTLSPPGF